MGMRRRLHFVLEETKFRKIQRAAEQHGMTVSEWVRWALLRARRTEPTVDIGQKLDAVRVAARHEYPTAPIDQMLREIEKEHVGGGE